MTRDFEDHCWKDVTDPETIAIYQACVRDLFVGERPAVPIVDVYRASYDGGARPVAEVVAAHPNLCGERARAMVEPAQRLLQAARRVSESLLDLTPH